MRAILHVDMDAFYASVEELDDPSLRGKPLIVGGASRRGVVTAASYAARKFGVHSAMPMAEALRLCPRAHVVAPRRDRYLEISAAVFAIFRRFTPLVEGLSIDEAFLDVTASRSLFGEGEGIARAIKTAVKEEVGLTASAGVAPSKFVAKIASDIEKPDGLVVVEEADVRSFLAKLPIERMWGVGPKTAPHLRALGLTTLGHLAAASPALLERTLGTWGAEVQRLARGEDPREVDPDRAAKSIGAEETYEHDLTTYEEIDRTLLAHASRVAQRLFTEGLAARAVTVKIKYQDFVVRSRQATFDEPVTDTDSLFSLARDLVRKLPLDRGVRLTGVSAGGLVDGDLPVTLFPDPRLAQRKKLEGVVAKVAARFGGEGLTRATLLESGITPVAPDDPRKKG